MTNLLELYRVASSGALLISPYSWFSKIAPTLECSTKGSAGHNIYTKIRLTIGHHHCFMVNWLFSSISQTSKRLRTDNRTVLCPTSTTSPLSIYTISCASNPKPLPTASLTRPHCTDEPHLSYATHSFHSTQVVPHFKFHLVAHFRQHPHYQGHFALKSPTSQSAAIQPETDLNHPRSSTN